MSGPRELSPKKQAEIRLLFTDLPERYPEIEFQLSAMYREFRTAIAAAIEPKLNEFLRANHPGTAAEFKSVADLVTITLTNLGLCLSVAGEPGLLVAERPYDAEPHFSVLTRRSGRPAYNVIPLSNSAPTLTIMAAPENIDHYFRPLRDYGRTARGGGRSSRPSE